MKKISVIIPVYNVEKFLEKSVRSVFNQTYNNLEIILIDDGSTDNSGKICDELAKENERVIVVHKKNGGLSSARNRGLEIAQGTYISFIDSDDIISEDMFETMINLMEQYGAEICSCKYKTFSEKSGLKFIKSNKIEIIEKENSIKCLLSGKITNHFCNKIFTKQMFDGVKFTDGIYYEDIDMMYRVLEKTNKIVVMESEMYGYLMRNTGITSNISKKSFFDYNNSVFSRYKYLETKYQELRPEINANIAHMIFLQKLMSYKLVDFHGVGCLLQDNYKLYCQIIKKQGIKHVLNAVYKDSLKNKILKILWYIVPGVFSSLMKIKYKIFRTC